MNWKIEALNEANISEMQSVTDKPIFSRQEEEHILKYGTRYRLVSESGRDWFLHTRSMMMTKCYALFYQGELYDFCFNDGFVVTAELRHTNKDAPFLLSVLNEVFALYGKTGDWEFDDNGTTVRDFFNEIRLAGIRLNGEPFMLPNQIQQKEISQLIEPEKAANQLNTAIKEITQQFDKPCMQAALDASTIYLSSLSSNNCVLSVNSVGVYLWFTSKSYSYHIDHQYINSFSSFMTEVVWKEILQAEKNLHFLKDQPKIAASRENTALKIEALQQKLKHISKIHWQKQLAKQPKLQSKINTYIDNNLNANSMLEIFFTLGQISFANLLDYLQQKPIEIEEIKHEIELLQQQISTLEVQAFCQYCLSPRILALFDSLREIWPVEDQTTYCAAIRSFAAQAQVELDPIA